MEGRPGPSAAERAAWTAPGAAAPDLGRAGYTLGLALAFVLAAALRLQRVLAADFPLHDGGLIYVMVRDLQASGFRLPLYSSYNGGQVPFAYPPLGLYLAAVLDRLTPASALDLLRFLPLALSLLTVGAFALLARSLLPSRGAALAAALLFASYSEGFSWFIMGGGLTRSLGLLFALLALFWLHRLYTGGRYVHAWASGVCGGLALLSHVEMAWFLALSGLFLLAGQGERSLRLLKGTALAALCALVVSAPWWATVLGRYGPDTFVASGSSRTFFALPELAWVGQYHLTHDPVFVAALVLAALGALTAMREGGRFIVAWLVGGALAAPWLFPRLTGLPLHLLAGTGLWSGVRRLGPGSGGLLAAGLAVALAGATAALPVPIDEPLAPATRQAMAWVGANTPPGSRFLVVENRTWWDDVAAEWFPALTGRISVATPQGLEWVPGAFHQHVDAYESLQKCAEEGAECLGRWAEETGLDYDYVFVTKQVPYDLRRERDDCCPTLRGSLAEAPQYETVYDGPGATIFRRR